MCRGHSMLPATDLNSAKDSNQKPIKEKTTSASSSSYSYSSSSSSSFSSSSSSAAAKSMPTSSQVKKWKESFSHVMSSQTGRTVFGDFLRLEYSEENMDFWVACEDYKKSAPSELVIRAKHLYLHHVVADAPSEVNLDAATREETRLNLQNTCPSCFNEAQKMIYTLMERDSYMRFLNSKLIQDLPQKRTTSALKKKDNCERHKQAITGST